MKIRKHMIFYGDVQGVGFRYRATTFANELGLTGWVRNEDDGTVTLEAQGEEGVIDMLVQKLNRAPFIDITGIDTKKLPIVDGERSFRTLDNYF
ncbi:MAG: acylphosphatase [Catonella sp.]|nr:acylphosphatase [Catonella sp.]MDY6357727.1 acylphosphatase [Catonella sp.]